MPSIEEMSTMESRGFQEQLTTSRMKLYSDVVMNNAGGRMALVLASQKGSYAGAWLQAVPWSPDLQLDAVAFRGAAQRRLAVPLRPPRTLR